MRLPRSSRKSKVVEMSRKALLVILIKECVSKAYQYDYSLIRRGMEQASVARIYYYMQEALRYDSRFSELSNFNLDSEYNKNGIRPKRTSRFAAGTRPDIILHHREDDPHQENILILEFKASGENIDVVRDLRKLEDFTSSECGYNYFLGVLVKLNVQEAEYRYFQNGVEKQEGRLND